MTEINFYSLNGRSLKPIVARTLPDGRIEVEDMEKSRMLFRGFEYVNPWGDIIEGQTIHSRAQRWNRETAPARGGVYKHEGFYDGR